MNSQLSYTQHGMWIAARTGAGTAYHMPIVVTLDAAPDRGALAKACRAVVERHPLLGCALRDGDGDPVLVPAAELPGLEEAGSVEEAVTRPFDLARGPLVRFALVGDETLVVVAHHLVFDGQSKDLLVADLAAYYEGSTPAELEHSDHAGRSAAQRERVEALLPEATAFWAGRWHEPDATAVPGGSLRSRRAAAAEASRFPLEIPRWDAVTQFEVLVAAVHVLLASYGNAEVATALDLSTRTEREAGHVGPYVNELPLFSRPSADTPFARFAADVRAELRGIYRYREVPLARAVPGLRPHAALAPVSISYRRLPGTASPLGEVQWLAANGSVRGALQLQVAHGPSGAVASLRHDPLELPDAGRFAADLAGLLAAVAADPQRPLGELVDFAPALPATVAEPQAPAAPADAGDPLVAQVREIWEQVLERSPIGPHEDIFDLGGHSLTITQIIARMQQQLGVEIGLDDFFDNSTIAGVVAVVRR
ncbi:condensation domain-containing protein [Streptomyces cocklensis]|uniref:Condensation domain-containing protein n=1 Tax=Actinacidiphila cocklensis TaxID=887465 RepID=A0A9W4E8H3_9ACTN|nr:condensation domain-containing protein [Actinacidiphila cocklensis]MDD1063083.1 condensation domain-containing protein [Actinacidiphila cocklensis]WSX77155.1 condensation domain-containing protein [Streptomyces sp. NBC_00899]CAG6395519.1 Condensation domain-containing protein [Actinacidiphila cocklensis]